MPLLRKAVDSAFSKAPGLPGEISAIGIMEDLNIVSRSYTGGRISLESAYGIATGLMAKILEADSRKLRRIGVRIGKMSSNESLDNFF